MKPLICTAMITALTMTGFNTPANAQSFEPHASCKAVLKAISGDNVQLRTVALVWGFGYLAAHTGKSIALTPKNINGLLPAIQRHCKSDATTYAQAVLSFSKAQANSIPDEEEEGETVLMRFLQPAADTRKLTLQLKPTEDEIRAIFKEPMASRVIAYVEQMFSKGRVAPKPGQTRLLSMFTNTSSLIAEQPVLEKFPGGYKDVIQYMNPKIVVARFSFVEPGKARGMSFDGLYKVNGRWVLIPKPWRALK